jgi:hypothetical protein
MINKSTLQLAEEAGQYLKNEIAQLKNRNSNLRIEIGQTISKIREIEKKNWPLWRIDRKIVASLNRGHISDLRREIHKNYDLLMDCRMALDDLQYDDWKTTSIVLKKLNKYWRAYYRDNLGEQNDTLAVIIGLIPGLGRSLLPETLWCQGQKIRRELNL